MLGHRWQLGPAGGSILSTSCEPAMPSTIDCASTRTHDPNAEGNGTYNTGYETDNWSRWSVPSTDNANGYWTDVDAHDPRVLTSFPTAWVRTSVSDIDSVGVDRPLETKLLCQNNGLSAWKQRPHKCNPRTCYGKNASDEATRMYIEVYFGVVAAYRGFGPRILSARVENVPTHKTAWPTCSIVMEKGVSVRDLLRNPGLVHGRTFDAIGDMISECIERASRSGFVMFDLKPCNMLVVCDRSRESSFSVQCIDFDPRFVLYVASSFGYRSLTPTQQSQRLDVTYIMNAVLLSMFLLVKYEGNKHMDSLRFALTRNAWARTDRLQSSDDELWRTIKQVTLADARTPRNECTLVDSHDRNCFSVANGSAWNQVKGVFVLIVRQYTMVLRPTLIVGDRNGSLLMSLLECLSRS